MIHHLLSEQPANPHEFLIRYLAKEAGGATLDAVEKALSSSQKSEEAAPASEPAAVAEPAAAAEPAAEKRVTLQESAEQSDGEKDYSKLRAIDEDNKRQSEKIEKIV